MPLALIPNKAAYLLELSTSATSRETANVPAQTRSLERQAIHLVDSRVDGLTWRREITEYWLESAATQRVRDAIANQPRPPAKPGRAPPPTPEPKLPGSVAALRSKPVHALTDLTRVHMLEVRCAPLDIGLGTPVTVVSDLRNTNPGLEGAQTDDPSYPLKAESIYAATILPALVDELKEGQIAAGRLRIKLGAGIFTAEHTASVIRLDDDLVVESTLAGPPTSQTANFITLTLTVKGTMRSWLATDALPNRAEAQYTLELHGRRDAPDEPPQEADLLTQTIRVSLTRIPVGWDQNRLITVGWMA